MYKTICVMVAFAILCSEMALCQSPVDRSIELKPVLSKDTFQMADGPAWDGWRLWVPDVKARTLVRYFPRGLKQRQRMGQTKRNFDTVELSSGRISAAFYNHGKIYLADNGASKVWAMKNGRSKLDLVTFDPMAKPKQKPNDLVVDHDGGVYITLTQAGQVVFRSAAGELNIAVEGFDSPNGIILSPDEKTLYVSSYKSNKVWAYDVVSPGKVGNGREFASLEAGDTLGADGMAMDRAGNVYCAGPTAIWIWNPNGELLDKIACPQKPINCTFGGAEMRSLFIPTVGPAGSRLFKQQMRISGRSPHPDSTPNLELGTTKAKNSKRGATAIPDDFRVELDVVYSTVESRKLLMDIIAPKEKPRATVILVHGGGWTNGDKTKFRLLAIQMASKGYLTATIEYRLADEAAFPAAVHDCFSAVRFLRSKASDYRIEGAKMFAVGGSAGGHLVGLMATAANDSRLLGTELSQFSSSLDGAVVMAGPLQIATGSVADRSITTSNSNAVRWLRCNFKQDPELYELADAHLHISASTCPIQFMVGELDNPERNEASRKKLREFGVPTELKVYPNAEHGCWNESRWQTVFANDIDEFFSELKN